MTIHVVKSNDPNPDIKSGDEVIFEAGIHNTIRTFNVDGLSNVTFTFDQDAKIDAFENVSGWEQHDTNIWKRVDWRRSSINKHGSSRSGYRADWSIDLLTNDDTDAFDWFMHKTSLSNLGPNEWYLHENANGSGRHTVYVYSEGNPDLEFNRVVMSAGTQHFLQGSGRNITLRVKPGTDIKSLYVRRPKIRGYGTRAQTGTIDIRQDGAENWTMYCVDVEYNHGIGIYVGADNIRLKSCHFDWNGQMGIGGAGTNSHPATNNLVHSCSWNHNNQAGFSWGWEGGGSKFVRQKDLVVRWCQFNDNMGPGFWADIDNYKNHVYRNEAFRNQGPGLFYEISSHGYFHKNWCVDNGTHTGKYFAWGGQVLLSSSPDCEVVGNHFAVTHTGGTGKPDGIGIVQQRRGNFSNSDGSKLGGKPRLSLRHRVHHNEIFMGVDVDGHQNIIGLQADYDDTSFQQSNNFRIDHNDYWWPKSEGNSIFQYDTLVRVDNLQDWQARTPFDNNSTGHAVSSIDEFPQGWNESPGWFDIMGKNYEAQTFTERIQDFPIPVRAYTMNDADNTVEDASPWHVAATNVNGTPGVPGIGDGNTAIGFRSVAQSYVDMHSDELETWHWNADEFTIAGYFRPTDGSWTNGKKQTFLRIGQEGGSGDTLAVFRQSDVSNVLEIIAHRNGDDTSVSRSYNFTQYMPFIWQLSYVAQENSLWVGEDVVIDQSSVSQFGWDNRTNITENVFRLGSARDSEYADVQIAHVYVWNGGLPLSLIEEFSTYMNTGDPIPNVPGTWDVPSTQIYIRSEPIQPLTVQFNDPDSIAALNTIGLPEGLVYVDNGDNTLTISGTPTDAEGTYQVALEGSDGVNDTVDAVFTIILEDAPDPKPPPPPPPDEEEFGFGDLIEAIVTLVRLYFKKETSGNAELNRQLNNILDQLLELLNG